jgi:hypothetical protein
MLTRAGKLPELSGCCTWVSSIIFRWCYPHGHRAEKDGQGSTRTVVDFPIWIRCGDGVSGTVYKYETAHFALFYQTSGPNAVYNAAQVDGNGVPVAIDSIGAIAEQCWRLAMDTLGYKAPVGISSLIYYGQAVPSGKMPIEVADMGYANTDAPWNNAMMSLSTDPSLDQINQVGCEIVVENDFLYGSPAKPIQALAAQAPGGILYDYSTPADIYKGWKVAVSREFFHTVEFGYDYAYQYAYHNMCAVWFQLRTFPDINDHWKYLPAFITDKFGGAFASGGSIPYGNYVFVREFAHIFGDSAIRKTWEFRSRRMYIDTATLTEAPWFAEAMDSLGYSQFTLIKDYSMQIADLIYNKPVLLNDGGLYQSPAYVAQPTLTTALPNPSFYDVLQEEYFGVGDATYTWTSIVSGLHFQIDSMPAQSIAYGYIVHLPSLKIEPFDNHVVSAVFAIDTGDTAISAALIGGYLNPIVKIRFTTAPVSGIKNADRLPALFVPTRRVDILGRSLNPDAQGLVIESDGVKTVPAIQLK